jgi:hypothetical protein
MARVEGGAVSQEQREAEGAKVKLPYAVEEMLGFWDTLYPKIADLVPPGGQIGKVSTRLLEERSLSSFTRGNSFASIFSSAEGFFTHFGPRENIKWSLGNSKKEWDMEVSGKPGMQVVTFSKEEEIIKLSYTTKETSRARSAHEIQLTRTAPGVEGQGETQSFTMNRRTRRTSTDMDGEEVRVDKSTYDFSASNSALDAEEKTISFSFDHDKKYLEL